MQTHLCNIWMRFGAASGLTMRSLNYAHHIRTAQTARSNVYKQTQLTTYTQDGILPLPRTIEF